jgi:hypothetical protein
MVDTLFNAHRRFLCAPGVMRVKLSVLWFTKARQDLLYDVFSWKEIQS